MLSEHSGKLSRPGDPETAEAQAHACEARPGPTDKGRRTGGVPPHPRPMHIGVGASHPAAEPVGRKAYSSNLPKRSQTYNPPKSLDPRACADMVIPRPFTP